MPSRLRAFIAAAATIGVSTVLALAAAEWIVGKINVSPLQQGAERAGVTWDGRDRLDVVMRARSRDPNWFPAVPANTYLSQPLLIAGRRVIPLGGVADASVVGCNENGGFSTFTTDEFGFNNPAGALADPRRKVFFVGDSFTQGDCLPQGETAVDRVRARRPATVNLGIGGNGPLFQLAAIREYIRPGEADTVVGMYYEGNDLADTRRDRADPLLARYLEPGFTQGLRAMQPQINAATRRMVEQRMAERLQGRATVLPKLRGLIWQARQSGWRLFEPTSAAPQPVPDSPDVAHFLEIIALAASEVRAKGGRLLFAYLPEYYRYAGPHLSEGAAERDAVLAGVRHLGIEVVDLHETFRQQDDPLSLFPFRLKAHYNSRGAELVAAALLDALPP